MSLADSTRIDASGARIVATGNIPVYIGGGSNSCFHGGAIIGRLPPSTPYDRMHDTYGMVARAPHFQVEGLRVFDYGDGVSMDASVDTAWSVRDVYFTYMRDDCVENDFLNSGTIENSLFDGCYEGFSARPYTKPTPDGTANLVTVRGSLFRLQDMVGYRRPGHGGFFKWHAASPMISLYHNVYRVDSPNIENDVLVPPAAKLKDCVDNVMIWLGVGPFPEPLPARPGCFRLLTGADGLRYWNEAVARWHTAHPGMAKDVAAPIVSVWSPSDGATVQGVVWLTATAVDDSAVVSVRFLLSGRPIGSAVTREAPVTKFTLSWNSRDTPSGRYWLSAVASDGAGNTTASDSVSVTIRN